MTAEDTRTPDLRAELLRRRLAGRATGRRQEIPRADRDRPLVLSFGQQQMWLLHTLDPDSPEYLVPLVLRLRGTLDESALRAALTGLLARHEVLRTRYALVDEDPVQLVDAPAEAELRVLAADDETELRRLVEHEVAQPFDLHTQWPVRMLLVRHGADEHVLAVTFHHIAVDAHSVRLFGAELSELYRAHHENRADALPAPGLQYADFAAWQRNHVTGEVLAAELDYWRDRLADLTPLDLPTDHPRPAVRSWHGEAVEFTIPAELAAAARNLATAQDSTLFTVLLSAYQLLLARHAGSTDIPVGVTLSGRARPELQAVFGYGINTLVVRGSWQGDPTLADLLSGTKSALLGAFDHQAVPFARLVDELAPERDQSRTPLFQADFILHEDRSTAFNLPGLVVESLTGNRIAKFDLTLELRENADGGLSAQFTFPPALFTAATVERMSGHYRTLLAHLVSTPDRRLSEVSLLDPAERALVLHDFNRTAIDLPAPHTLAELVSAQVARTPDALAVTSAGQSLTFAELNVRANQLAHHLRSLGAGPGTLVAVCAERSLELAIALHAVVKSGAAYVPLDPDYPAERLAYLLTDSAAPILLTQSHLDLPETGARTLFLDTPSWSDEPTNDPETGATPQDGAYLIYTSGSTGRPKGVLNTQRGIVNRLHGMQRMFQLTSDDVLLQKTAAGFDVAVWEFFWPAITGARLVLAEPGGHRDPRYLRALIAAEGVTLVHFVPSMLTAFLDEPDAAACPSLRIVLSGGEALPADLAARVLSTMDVQLFNQYGPAEAAIDVTAGEVTAATLAGSARVPIGFPVDNLRVLILDERFEPVPVGVPGQLFIAGDGLATGYLNRPALTAEKFLPHPFEPGRMYATGDLARWLPTGAVDFLGRADDQVKLRGLRIEPGEVAAVLREQPGVDGAVVVVRADQLIGYITGEVRPAALREALRDRLPDYLVPAAIVPLDRIPLSPNGKLDRRALPAPDRTAFGTAVHLAPRTPDEARIAELFGAVLELTGVGVLDSFFDLGGDSLRAVRLAAKLRTAGYDLGMRDVFAHRTVAALASAATTRTAPVEFVPVEPFALLSTTDREALPADVVDAYPLTQVQTGMLVEMLSGTGRAAYHNVNSFRVPDERPFDEAAFRAAVAEVTAQHDLLRTSMHLTGYSKPLQLVHAHAEIPVSVHDLREVEDHHERLLTFAAEQGTALFELTTAPLLRLTVHLEPSAWRLSVTEAHAITDGWSLNTLLMALLRTYHALRDGLPAPAEPAGARFADVVAAELSSVDSEEDRDYWQQVVDTHVPLVLPAWGEDAEGHHRIQVRYADLEPRLRELGADTSLKSVLLAAHTTVLGQLTAEPAFHTGLVCHGRLEAEGGDRVLGMHLNTLPFPVQRTARTWQALIAQVYATETEVWGHRRYPLPAVQRAAGTGDRLLSAMFDYQDFHQVDAGLIEAGATLGSGFTEFPLHVVASGGHVTLTARADTFSRTELDRLGEMYLAVLTAMAEDADGDPTAAHLPFAEETRLLSAHGRTVTVPVELCVHELFQEQVAETPDAVAVIAGGETLTYRELNTRANQLAHHLRSLGAGPETLVGVCLDRGPDLLPALLGILKAGAAYVPLDPANPVDRLAHILTDTAAPLVLTTTNLTDRLPAEHQGQVLLLDTLRTELAAQPVTDPAPLAGPDNLIYVIYTSGSTGRPKGVALTHANVARLFTTAADQVHFGQSDVWTLFHSYAFDVSVWEMWGALLHGARIVVVPGEVTRSPEDFLDLMVEHGATVLCQTPTAFRSLTALAAAGDPRIDRLRLRSVIFAGERLDIAELTPWTDRLGVERPALVNMYGITETTVHSSFHLLTGEDLASPARSFVGHPLPDSTIHLLDPRGALVPDGIPGEIHVGGPAVARGYLNRPELTAERFLPDPFGPPGARLYRSGDLAKHLPDGSLESLGRLDNQVKIRGYRIELGEIQARLREHPAVADAVVIARADATGERQLVAYLRAPEAPEAAVLRAFLGEVLPDYMVPAAFVVIDEIPLTPNGKLDHRALPAPDREAFTTTGQVAPRNPVEERIAAIWAEVLGLADVSVTDGFFDLGGDSIRAVRLSGALRQAGFDLGIREIFELRTVAALAARAATQDGPVQAAEPVAPFALVSTVDRERLPADVVDAYPLSQVQTGMLVEQLASPERNTYHNVNTFRIPDERPFDPAALRVALDLAATRHDILRTSMHLEGYSQPLQLVHESVRIPLTWHDVSHLNDEEQLRLGQEFVAAERGLVFELSTAPLLRVTAHVESATSWRLTFTQSHAITEGWSYHTLLMELLADYQRLRDGQSPLSRPVNAVRYADFVAAELNSLANPADQAFWQDVVDTHVPFELPEGWGGDPAEEGVANHVQVRFGELAPGLRALAARAGTGLKTVLLAAHLTVLRSLSPEPSIHSGLVLHGRLEAEGGEHVLGMHLNTVPFPAETGARTWHELVAQVFGREAAAWGHRRYPLPAIQRAAGGGRLIHAMFDYQDFHQVDRDSVDLGLTYHDAPTEFGLSISAKPGQVNLTGVTAVLSRANLERLGELYRAVLTAMAADPDGDATAIALPATERAALLAAAAGPTVAPVSGTLHDIFAGLPSQAPALTVGERTLNYGELNAEANRIAHRLRATGVSRGDLVGLSVGRSAHLVPGLIGILKAGAAYVPLDPTNPVRRLQEILADTRLSTVVTEAAYLDVVREVHDGAVLVLDDDPALATAPDTDPVSGATEDDLAYVIYTSGSTGRPKGVPVSHGNVLRMFSPATGFDLGPGEVWTMFHTYAFDTSVWEMWGALLHGARLVVVPAEATRSPADLLDLLVREQVTQLDQTPKTLSALAQLVGENGVELDQLALRRVYFGGEKLAVTELRPWAERLGLDRPELFNVYGITETTVNSTFRRITPADLADPGRSPIGVPMAGQQTHLLDHNGSLVPFGMPGELHIGGVGVAQGYLGRPALTAERFLPDPFGAPGSRLYRTGDLAVRRADGVLDFVGRTDTQVKIRGFRVEPGEIEARLLSHPAVREAVVLARPDATGEPALVAYLVAPDAPDADELRAHTAAGLPEYSVPTAFVLLPQIPLTSNGKVDRRALPAPDRAAFATTERVAPRTPAEQRMAAAWAEVLGLPVAQIGVEDSFFTLGGDSIRAIQLVGALRAAGFGSGIREVFAHRTIAALLAGDPGAAEVVPTVEPFALLSTVDREQLPAGVADAYPLTQVQTGMLVEMLSGDGGAYHNLNSFQVPDERPFDLAVLREAARVVAGHHDVLRTSLHLTGYSRPLQLVHAEGTIPVTLHDLRQLDQAAQHEAGLEFQRTERSALFEPETAPLLRIAVHLTGDTGWLLTFTHCHAVTEGWSLTSLLGELLDTYRALRDGTELPDVELPVRYADYVAAELSAVDSAEDREFWHEVVATHAPLTLPSGWGAPGPRELNHVRVDLTEQLDGLRALAERAGTSLKSVLLAGHLKALSLLTHDSAFHSGLVLHGRLETEGGDRVLGMHLNTLPFPHTGTARTWLELVEQTFAAESRVWPHRRFPLPEIQRAAGGGRLLNVLFDYLDFHQLDAAVTDLAAGVGRTANEFALNVIAVGGAITLTGGSDQLAREHLDRLAGIYLAVLTAMAVDPFGDATASPLPDRDRVLAAGTGDTAELPHATVLDLIEAQALSTPEAVAVRFGTEVLSYRELDQRANRIAHHLRGLGAGQETLVGVCLDRDLDLVPALLGVWKTGAGYLPLDPSVPTERLALMLADTGNPVVLTAPRHADRLAGDLVLLSEIDLSELPTTAPTRVTEPDNLAYVIYTSGSTGRPKGVMATHRGLLNYLLWTVEAYAAAGDGGAPLFSSIAFDLGIPNLFAPLLSGQTATLLPQDLDTAELGAQLAATAPHSFIKLTPGHLDLLTHQLTAAQAHDLAGLVIAAGDAFPTSLVHRWRELAGNGTPLATEYGPTEITIGNSGQRIDDLPGTDLIPLGESIPNSAMHVLDAYGEPAPVGVPGEVYISGAGLARGYLGQPALTAERFLPDPHGPAGSRRYRTGDLGRLLPDGSLESLGRMDNQVKIRGYRVELGEIQAVLTGWPGVTDAVVALREDTLVAYLTGAQVDTAELRAGLAARLPEYMVPSAFVQLDAIPLTANGKVDQRALPAPDRAARTSVDRVAPETELEQRIAAVWASVLDLAEVGVTDSFFDLGGDSMRAVRLAGALREQGLDLGIREIYQLRTVRALAAQAFEQAPAAPFRTAAPFSMISAADRSSLPADVVDAYPLSQVQTGMLVEALSSVDGAAYHNINSFRVPDDQPFDQDALREAARVVAQRHEILRTSMHLEGYSQPLQLVHADGALPVLVHDMRSLDAEEQQTAALTYLAEEKRRLFDLTTAPLMRLTVHLESDSAWRLTFTSNHATTEGWSYHSLLVELLELYRCLRDGLDLPEFSHPEVRFADFVAAELASLADPADTGFWREVVTEHEPFTLPAAWAAPGPRTPVRAQAPFADLEPGLRALAGAAGASFNSVLLAAHLKTMSLLTSEPAFHTGLVVHGRIEAPGGERVLGMHLNTVPLPHKRTARTWLELVEQTFATETALWTHRRHPLPAIQRAAGTDRLISVLFEYLDFHQVDTGLVDHGGEFHSSPNEFALDITATGGHVILNAGSDVLSQANADRLASLYRAVLSAMVADPQGDATAALLPDGEQELLLRQWNGPTGDLPVSGLHEVFERRAAEFPAAIAVTAGDVQLTYAQLDARANQLAHHLRALGAGPERIVGVCLDRGPDLVPTLLAILKTGAAYVPLDPVNPPDRLALLLTDTAASLVVTDAANAGLILGVHNGRVVVLDDERPAIAAQPVHATGVPADPDRLVYVIYTSGSTGTPKGVSLSHAAVLALFDRNREIFEFTAEDVWALFHSYAFDVSVWEMWGALLHGARLVVVPADTARSPEDLVELLVAEQVTVLEQTAMTLRALTSLAAEGDPRLAGLSLRLLTFGGEKLDAAELRPWADRLGLDRPALVNTYGITETAITSTHHRITSIDLDSAGSPIGLPLQGQQLHLLDAHGGLVPVGAPGEIHVGGVGLARGYLNRPALTAERFVPDPFGPPGSRLYRSGDLAVRRADGVLDFVGRADNQVKIRGYRVELGEVQAALTALSGVRSAAVIVRDDQLVAYPVGTDLDVVALRDQLAARLPEYLVPSAFVLLDRLPLTPNGKLDHRALPAPDRTAFAGGGLAPRTPAETRMAAVWAEVLGFAEVGVEDSFFDLGGDSIRVVSLVGALRAAGFGLTVRDVFTHRTIAALAALETGSVTEFAPVAPFALLTSAERAALPAGLVDAYPLSQVQTGMLVEMLSSVDGSTYHNVNSFRLPDDQPFSETAFRAAVAQLVERHDLLRTSLHLDGFDRPLQLVHAEVEVPLAVHDLRSLDGAAQVLAGQEFLAAERVNPVAVDVAPALRVAVHLESESAWRLTVTETHATTDGWSLNSLLMELLGAYRALRDGRTHAAPAVPVRYADFIAAELSSLDSEEDVEFWQRVVTEHTPFTLPTAWADAEAPAGGYHVSVPFSDLADDLRALARESRTSLKSVLLAAHLHVLSALTPEPAFHSGFVLHGRLEVPGGERVLGMHLNTVPLPHDRSARTWQELVSQAFAAEAAVWSHRRHPLPAIQRLASVDRLLAVLFDYQDFHQVDTGLVDTTAAVGTGTNEFALNVTASPDRIVLATSAQHMSRPAADRLAAHYRAVLEAMAARTDLAVLPAAQRALITETGIGSTVDWPVGTVLDLFAASVAAGPEASAVVCGEVVLTFRELDQRANRLAHHLRSLGAGPDAPVGVLLDRGLDLVPTLLGILKAGAAYLPLDPGAPVDRLRYQLADAAAAIVVTDLELPGYPGILVDPAGLPEQPVTAPETGVGAADLAYVIYTSGSTGRPKGVMVEHGGLVNYLRWAADAYTRRAVGGAPLFSSIAFDLPATNLFLPLITGQPVHLVDAEPAELGEAFTAAGPFSFIKLTPAHLDLLSHQLSAAQLNELAGTYVVGGEALPPATSARWLDILGPDRLINEFGPTEATIANVIHPITDTHDGTVPIGRPIPNTSAVVLDGAGNLVPVGALGELHIGGVGVAWGYLNQPALTAERFVPDPHRPGARRYRTGDLAYLHEDGTLDFLGRLDSQVKIRGYRVELGEVQTALAALTREAFVRAVDGVLVAYVVTDEQKDLRAELAKSLPDYMIPAAIVPLTELPLTPNGKVDQRALPAPDVQLSGQVAPRNPLEQRIAAIWCEVLGLTRAGVHDSFFELGGDSIRAVRLSAALRAADLDIGIRELYRHRTIAELAEHAGGRPAAEFVPVEPFALLDPEDRAALPAGLTDAYPLSQVQTGMVVESLAAPDLAKYHNVGSFRIPDTKPFDVTAFRAALDLVTARHEVLRTSVRLTGFRGPVQLVHDGVSVPLTVHDLRGLNAEEQHEAAKEFLRAENQAVFDLERPPLVRLAVHLEPDAWRLTFTHHHAVTDGWTVTTLLMELLSAYRGAEPLPTPGVRYADFIAAELSSLDSAEDRGHWQRVVDEHVPFTLPEAWAGTGDEPYSVRVTFGDLADGLRDLARTARTSLKSVLLAAHLHVLSTITPEPGFHSGLVLHGRLEAEGGERVLGMHLNTLPLPHDRSARSWLDLVRQAFEGEAEIWAHRRFPMPEIQRSAEAERLITVLFDYLDFHQVDEQSVDTAAGLGSGVNDFALNVLASGEDLVLGTSTAALSREGADRLAELYRQVLTAMVADPHGAVRTVLHTEPLLAQGTGPAVDRPQQTVVDLIAEQAKATPDAVAVTSGTDQLTYRELLTRANRIAHRLQQLGAGPESLVGVLLRRGSDLLPALLGVWQAGAAYLPLDEAMPAERIAVLLGDTETGVLLTESALHDRIPAGYQGMRIALDTEPLTALPDTAPARRIDGDQLAYVIHTSGSTGRPKGVMATHGSLLNYLLWTTESYAARGTGGSAVFSPISFDLGIPNLFAPLLTGQTTHLLPAGLDTAELGSALAARGPYSFVKLTPAHLELLTHQLTPQQAHDLAGLVIAAGDAFPLSLVRRWRELAGTGTPLATEYGPTEITIGNSGQPVDALTSELLPLGESIPNTAMHVLDAHGDLVPIGVPGEVYISGAGLARGYLDQPALTAEKFLPNPYGEPGSRIYRSGDLGRWLPDGSLDTLGRKDDQVKIRGYRVELGEIQARLLEYPEVREAVVLARANTLVAYLVTTSGAAPDAVKVREHLAGGLPEYMVPSAILTVDRIPLTANGKLDHRALPSPDRAAFADVAPEPPRTPAEQRVAELWREVLGVEQIGVQDNFFALGGDSLRAARLLALAQQRGLPLSMWMVYQSSTLAELASLAEPQLPQDSAVDLLEVPLPAPVDPGLFDQAVQAVIAHHDALRLPADGPVLEADLGNVVRVRRFAVDRASWPVLRADLATAYQQLSDGEPVQLPPAGSVHAILRRQAERAAQPELLDEAHHWLGRVDGPPLPITAGPAETHVTTPDVPFAGQQDLLLAALAGPITAWTGGDRLTVDVTHDPRDGQRLVGPLLTSRPVSLWLPRRRDPAAMLRAVRRQLAAEPSPGDYGLLRDQLPELADQPAPQVALGHDEAPLSLEVHSGQLYWTFRAQEVERLRELADECTELLATLLRETTTGEEGSR
ncbi:non-ribosomal peptide synthetase [Lentzea kentuckyensis]|uniref:non-ribosomal peptide synthetase n=1 Tax=Lentzea kentuckyensis TaxID=360086 RepID=UPI000A38AE56|nr:non-ribosomal peptide synthetase [Lentzea kentuckyensis]